MALGGSEGPQGSTVPPLALQQAVERAGPRPAARLLLFRSRISDLIRRAWVQSCAHTWAPSKGTGLRVSAPAQPPSCPSLWPFQSPALMLRAGTFLARPLKAPALAEDVMWGPRGPGHPHRHTRGHKHYTHGMRSWIHTHTCTKVLPPECTHTHKRAHTHIHTRMHILTPPGTPMSPSRQDGSPAPPSGFLKALPLSLFSFWLRWG